MPIRVINSREGYVQVIDAHRNVLCSIHVFSIPKYCKLISDHFIGRLNIKVYKYILIVTQVYLSLALSDLNLLRTRFEENAKACELPS